MMWQNIVIGVLVGLAAIYLFRRLRRMATGESICDHGACDSCVTFSGCAGKPVDGCRLAADKPAEPEDRAQ